MSLERELGHISAKLENIEDLLLTQNSRVSKLEDKVDSLRLWRASLVGIAGVTSVIVSFFVNMFR